MGGGERVWNAKNKLGRIKTLSPHSRIEVGLGGSLRVFFDDTLKVFFVFFLKKSDPSRRDNTVVGGNREIILYRIKTYPR